MPKPKKVLFLSHDTGTYGAQMSLYLILKGLNRDLYEPIVNFHRDGPLVDLVKALDIKVVQHPRIRLTRHAPPEMGGWPARLSWPFWEKVRGENLVRLIQNENIDLVYTNTMVCYEGAYAARRTGRPHIWHLREILPNNQKLYGVFGVEKTLDLITQHSTRVVCVSEGVRAQFPHWQRTPEQFEVIYNGIDPELFNPDTIQPTQPLLRDELRLQSDVPLLAYVARISPQKGFGDLIEACAILKQENTPFHLLVFGESIDAAFMAQMEQRMDEAALRPHITLMGKQPYDRISGYLKQVDVFVTPSREEPFARSILEAMSMALPVVGTDSGGTPESVAHGETGLIAQTRNPASLAQTLKTMLTMEPAQRVDMGQKGRQRVRDKFTIGHYMERIHAVLDDTLQR